MAAGQHRRVRRIGPVAALALVAILLGACDRNPAEPPDDGTIDVDAGAYAAVLTDFLPAAPGDGDAPVVYIVPLGETSLSLDDQVVLIDAVDDTHEVRFVDEIRAAFVDDEGNPRANATVIGLGKVRASEPHTIRVEVYATADRVVAYMVTLRADDDGWQVDHRDEIEPELLDGDA